MSRRADSLLGAGVFGTSNGLGLAGIGCLSKISPDLGRRLDIRGWGGVERDESYWFSIPIMAGSEHGSIIARVSYALDQESREGFVGAAVAFSKSHLDRIGFSSAIATVEQLHAWAAKSCVDSESRVFSIERAHGILGNLPTIPPAPPPAVRPEDPQRLLLPQTWLERLSLAELFLYLNHSSSRTRAALYGFVLRQRSGWRADDELTDAELGQWAYHLFGGAQEQMARLREEAAQLEGQLQAKHEELRVEAARHAETRARLEPMQRQLRSRDEQLSVMQTTLSEQERETQKLKRGLQTQMQKVESLKSIVGDWKQATQGLLAENRRLARAVRPEAKGKIQPVAQPHAVEDSADLSELDALRPQMSAAGNSFNPGHGFLPYAIIVVLTMLVSFFAISVISRLPSAGEKALDVSSGPEAGGADGASGYAGDTPNPSIDPAASSGMTSDPQIEASFYEDPRSTTSNDEVTTIDAGGGNASTPKSRRDTPKEGADAAPNADTASGASRPQEETTLKENERGDGG